MKKGYKLTKPMIELYYNIMGVSDVNIDEVRTDVRWIEDISPLKLMDAYDELFSSLDDNVCILLENFYNIYVLFGEEVLDKYIRSINVILKAATNINLISSDSQDFELMFNRINYIIRMVLLELNSFSVDIIVSLADAIKKGNYRELESFCTVAPNTALILLLSMNSNKDIKDYQIYVNKDDYNLNICKVIGLINANQWDYTDVQFDDTPFRRLSYKKSFEMTMK